MTRVVALLVLAAGAAAGGAPGRPRVWCVGDSLTQRYAPRVAAAAPGWDVGDFGVGGERSDAGRDRFTQLLATADAPPDVVVVEFGTNDVASDVLRHEPGYGPAEVVANVRDMAARAQARGACVLVGLPVGTPAPRPSDPAEARAIVRALRRGFAHLRRQLRAAYPGATVDLRLETRELFVDVLHPTPAGSELLAGRVVRAVRRRLRR